MRAAGSGRVDRGLRRDLESAAPGQVSFSDGALHLYTGDGSNYRQVPIGVATPRGAEEVVNILEACRRRGVPVLARGAGTSLAGQACNEAVVIDLSRHMNRILEIDPEQRLARVEPGVVLDQLREAAARYGLTFGPDPATHAWCTLGGMIGNNSCGAHSLAFGKTDESVEALRVVTGSGLAVQLRSSAGENPRDGSAGERGDLSVQSQLQRLCERHATAIRRGFPSIPRAVSGYNLPALLPENGFNVARSLVGSEGTCAIVLEATVRLVPRLGATTLVVLAYGDVFRAADSVPEITASGCVALEGFDALLVELMRKKRLNLAKLEGLPPGGAWLLAEFAGASTAEADAAAHSLVDRLGGSGSPPASVAVVTDPAHQQELWDVRESALAGAVRVPGWPDAWEGWEDSAVAPERLGAYLRDLQRLLDDHGYRGPFYGHFGHGCVHNRLTFDFSSESGIRRYRHFVEAAADLVASYGGSLSGEHGDGQSRGELLARMFSPELVAAFREFKSIWDPDGLLNPGKLIDARPIDRDLKYGPGYRPRELATVFRFADDGGSLTRAVGRCIGVGKCRRPAGGFMCPSFMATNEEEHSTRGRAHLLAEMLRGGDGLRGGWQSRAVREALDLCLACKGCKSDCPVSVDMATYKAEFLFHHYRRRLRPRAAYTMGLIHWWARAGSHVAPAANLMLSNPLSLRMLRSAAGISPERTLPRLAPVTFASWFRRRPRSLSPGPPCVVWPDTFVNHFAPWIGRAAVEVVELLGMRPVLPVRQGLCCGRPLFDFGMLDLARHQLRRVLTAMEPALRLGVPVLVLEPSCLSVFRDELVNLFPDDDRARQLAARAVSLAELLNGRDVDLPQAAVQGPALVQVHCHERSVIGDGPQRAVLSRLGIERRVPEPGCCGMAGTFGFEQGRKHAISMTIGERNLLPAIRGTDDQALVIADGFSCREQISQGTGRRALHLAEVVRMALTPNGERYLLGPADWQSAEHPGRKRAATKTEPAHRSSWTGS
jgi:FAD/FMN-containing dehydrogenase/Fe-S oxidoreductase